MNKKRRRKLNELIDTLEGVKDGIRPPYRILLYDLQIDGFRDVSAREEQSKIKAELKTLLLIHGTASKTTAYVLHQAGWEFDISANQSFPNKIEEQQEEVERLKKLGSFAELLYRNEGEDSYLKQWLSNSKYEQVIAIDHLTLRDDIKRNTAWLMELLPATYADAQGEKAFVFEKDVDILAGSRGGLFSKYLAVSFTKEKVKWGINTKIPVGNAVLIATPNGTNILNFDQTFASGVKREKKRYKKALKRLIDRLTLTPALKFYAKRAVDLKGQEIQKLINQPGLKIQDPDHPFNREIIRAKPASPLQKGTLDATESAFLPINGKFDGTIEDHELVRHPETGKSPIQEITDNIMSFYHTGKLFRILFFDVKVSYLINADNLRGALQDLFTRDIVQVWRPKLFQGDANDLLVASREQYIVHPEHYASGYHPADHQKYQSVAVHGYYFRQYFMGTLTQIRDISKNWLEDPSISNDFFKTPTV